MFVFRSSICTLIRPLVFSFELFYICDLGPFKADYVVWAYLIVEGRTVTDSYKILCHLVSGGELSHWQQYHIFFIL